MVVIFILFVVLMLFNPIVRAYIFNLPRLLYLNLIDMFNYIRFKKWRIFGGYGLKVYVGYFGRGKTLSAVKEVVDLYIRYSKYNDITVYSNIKLNTIPYIPLVDVQQIIDAPSNSIFLIDEISTLFNSRDWANFNPSLLLPLLQCRKKRKMIIATAQRFEHCDKTLRDVTDKVIDCNNHFRLQYGLVYDGWDYGNCDNLNHIRSIGFNSFVATNRIYNAYDTSELVEKLADSEYIEPIRSTDDSNISYNKPTRKFQRYQKKYYKR